jgi:hypothetical protein
MLTSEQFGNFLVTYHPNQSDDLGVLCWSSCSFVRSIPWNRAIVELLVSKV